jgi:hypothetical protein
MVRPVVFVGPTLFNSPVLRDSNFAWNPPAAVGDVYRAACDRPCAIGIVDGQFEALPSVWHKEILWALTRGIHVFGASSMGAIRAAELTSFGMIGVGDIFHGYRINRIKDDDEVAVLHAPAELQYRPLTEAMVDVRATVAAATRAAVITVSAANRVTRIAKKTFFKERTWAKIIAAARQAELAIGEMNNLAEWLPANRSRQKTADALAMLDLMRSFLATNPRPFQPAFQFQRTIYWERLVRANRQNSKGATDRR